MLVLDLDETLIHSTYLGDPKAPTHSPDHYLDEIVTWERPEVRPFLSWALDHISVVGVWTAATPSYALSLLSRICEIDRLQFVYCRDRCTLIRNHETGEESWIKDIRKLRKFGVSKAKILCVDDRPENFARSYGNYLPISSFEGDPMDRELSKLKNYLTWLGPVVEVRSVDKRRWSLI